MPLPTMPTPTATSSASNPDGTASFPLAIARNPYPVGATPLQNSSGNVANAAAIGTLTSAIGRTAFITGFDISASGSTAVLIVLVTITGLLGGTRTRVYVFPAGVTAIGANIIGTFDPPLQASGTNVNIVMTLPAGGAGNTNAAVSVQGYMI